MHLAVQPRGIWPHIRKVRPPPRSPEVGVRPVLAEALRPKLGQKREKAVAAGGAKAGALDGSSHSGPIRAKLKDLGFAVDAHAELGRLPASLRGLPAAVRRGKQASPKAAWCGRGDIFIDLFGGVGRVGRRVSLRGGPNALLLDFSYGYDILSATAVDDIILFARGGRLKGIMLAIPCNSFSGARRAPLGSKMPRRLRSDTQPYGITGLCEGDVKTAEIGNRIVAACMRIIKVCNELRIPWIVENPRGSFLWKMPDYVKLAQHAAVRVQHCHQCQYKCPWMKPTTFMSGNCQYAPQLELRCCMRKGYCSKTNQPHFVLSNPSVTKQAQTYSQELAVALASVFREAWIAIFLDDNNSAFFKRR